MRLPHPLLLLLGAVGLAAVLTWVLPAGEFDRRDDAATGRRVVVAGTYHAVDPAPVGPFAAVVAVPRGFVEAADVIGLVLFVGAAWFVVDRLGTLGRVTAAFVARTQGRGLLAIPIIAMFFAAMGAVENMQEEIIPLVPALMLLGRGLGVDAVTVVAMSLGAAAVGSAFGPTNPFQAGIALKLAQLPLLSGGWLRPLTLAGALLVWVAWTLVWAARTRTTPAAVDAGAARASTRDALILAIAIAPIAAYVYGSVARGWGFNEMSAAFLVAGCAAGLVGGLGVRDTTAAYLEGMQALVPAAVLIGAARSLSIVLTDGRVTDTVLNAMATPLAYAPPIAAALLMVPFHAIVHVGVPSVSGQAVLTMPILVPLSDVLGISRQVTVLAYQIGAGLTELLTPTNGALMAVLLAAEVPLGRWLRFASVGVGLALLVGIAGMVTALSP